MTDEKIVKKAKETIETALTLSNIKHSKVNVGLCGFELKVFVYD